MTGEYLGLSKKTNIAIAGIVGITMAKDVLYAVIAIVVIVLTGLTYQLLLDEKRKGEK